MSTHTSLCTSLSWEEEEGIHGEEGQGGEVEGELAVSTPEVPKEGPVEYDSDLGHDTCTYIQ